MNKYEKNFLQQAINKSNNLVFVGGAGTSTDCGIPDFRGEHGRYKVDSEINPEEILSLNYYLSNPREFFNYYRKNMIFDWARPNSFHAKLVKLEQMGKLKAIITQNIDGLHQKAGSKNVIEIHGSFAHNYCRKCGKDYSEEYMKNSTGIPYCNCGGVIKPNVTLYGERIRTTEFDEAMQYIQKADTLIVAGTSLMVHPTASLIDYFNGGCMIIINKTETNKDNLANIIINDNITSVFEELDV